MAQQSSRLGRPSVLYLQHLEFSLVSKPQRAILPQPSPAVVYSGFKTSGGSMYVASTWIW